MGPIIDQRTKREDEERLAPLKKTYIYSSYSEEPIVEKLLKGK